MRLFAHQLISFARGPELAGDFRQSAIASRPSVRPHAHTHAALYLSVRTRAATPNLLTPAAAATAAHRFFIFPNSALAGPVSPPRSV